MDVSLLLANLANVTVIAMNKCLNCQQEYQSRRVTSKYCSNKCRAAFNRKKPLSNVSKRQVQELYEEMMAAIKNIGSQPPLTYFEGPEKATIVFKDPAEQCRLKIKRPFLTLQALIDECESIEAYEPLRKEIEEADHLTSKEKSILLRKR